MVQGDLEEDVFDDNDVDHDHVDFTPHPYIPREDHLESSRPPRRATPEKMIHHVFNELQTLVVSLVQISASRRRRYRRSPLIVSL